MSEPRNRNVEDWRLYRERMDSAQDEACRLGDRDDWGVYMLKASRRLAG